MRKGRCVFTMGVGVGIGVVGMGAEADAVGTGTGGCDVAVWFCGVDAGMGMG